MLDLYFHFNTKNIQNKFTKLLYYTIFWQLGRYCNSSPFWPQLSPLTLTSHIPQGMLADITTVGFTFSVIKWIRFNCSVDNIVLSQGKVAKIFHTNCGDVSVLSALFSHHHSTVTVSTTSYILIILVYDPTNCVGFICSFSIINTKNIQNKLTKLLYYTMFWKPY